jgi:hypothetical protein
MAGNPLEELGNKLSGLDQKAKEYFYSEVKKNFLRESFLNSIMTRLVAVLDEIQGEYFSGVAADDPTNPAREGWVSAIKGEVRQNILNLVSNIGSDGIKSFTILSDKFIGKGKEDDKTGSSPIQWLVHFIDGNFEDNLLWVDQKFIDENGWKVEDSLGRFGVGFLVKGTPHMMELYKDNKHPQSGKQGIGADVFLKAVTQNDLNDLVVKPAVEATIKYLNSVINK